MDRRRKVIRRQLAHLEPADAVPVLNFAEDERLGKRNQAVDILKAKFGEDIIKRGFKNRVL